MWIAFLFIIYLPTYDAFGILYPSEVHHLRFSDLTDMENYFLPEEDDNNNTLTAADVKRFREMEKNMSFSPGLLSDAYKVGSIESIMESFKTPSSLKGMEVQLFNEINQDIYNFTRKRYYGWFHGHNDNFDYNTYGANAMIEENKKVKMLRMIGLQFLIHSRYKIAGALTQRNKVRGDKRYKIGYLFNRLRRIKTEMLKMIAMAYEQFQIWWQSNAILLMRLYQQVTRMAIDIKDTCDYILQLWAVTEAYDFSMEAKTNAYGEKSGPKH